MVTIKQISQSLDRLTLAYLFSTIRPVWDVYHNFVVQIVCDVLAVMQGQPLLCQHRQIVHAHRENV